MDELIQTATSTVAISQSDNGNFVYVQTLIYLETPCRTSSSLSSNNEQKPVTKYKVMIKKGPDERIIHVSDALSYEDIIMHDTFESTQPQSVTITVLSPTETGRPLTILDLLVVEVCLGGEGISETTLKLDINDTTFYIEYIGDNDNGGVGLTLYLLDVMNDADDSGVVCLPKEAINFDKTTTKPGCPTPTDSCDSFGVSIYKLTSYSTRDVGLIKSITYDYKANLADSENETPGRGIRNILSLRNEIDSAIVKSKTGPPVSTPASTQGNIQWKYEHVDTSM